MIHATPRNKRERERAPPLPVGTREGDWSQKEARGNEVLIEGGTFKRSPRFISGFKILRVRKRYSSQNEFRLFPGEPDKTPVTNGQPRGQCQGDGGVTFSLLANEFWELESVRWENLVRDQGVEGLWVRSRQTIASL